MRFVIAGKRDAATANGKRNEKPLLRFIYYLYQLVSDCTGRGVA